MPITPEDADEIGKVVADHMPKLKETKRMTEPAKAMTKHSPEPWRIQDNDIRDGNGNVVMWEDYDTDIGGFWNEPSDDDKRRLVACVNACAGIPTDVLLRRDHDINTTVVDTQPTSWLSIPLKPNGDRQHRTLGKESQE